VTTKQSKGDRSRHALKLAARKVFESDGYTKARVQDIAAEAGLSNGAFYRYFSDKYAVMMTLLKELLNDAFLFARAPWDAGHPTDSVYTTTKLYLEFYSENQDLFRMMVEASQTHPEVEEMWAEVRSSVIDRVTRMLGRARDEGLVRDQLNLDIAAALLCAMTDQYAYLRFVLGRMPELEVSAASQQIAEIWSSGVFASSVAEQTN
jgi:AcrR family transcriptional regulator